MKKQLLFFGALLCLCMSSGCSDDDEKAPDSIYIHSNSLPVKGSTESDEITIYTTCAWEAAADEWITLDPPNGDKKGIHAVKLTFGKNTTGIQRKGNIVFKAGTYTQNYELIQEAQ